VTITSHRTYMNLTDAFFKQTFAGELGPLRGPSFYVPIQLRAFGLPRRTVTTTESEVTEITET
jgi:hypothetical protein